MLKYKFTPIISLFFSCILIIFFSLTVAGAQVSATTQKSQEADIYTWDFGNVKEGNFKA